MIPVAKVATAAILGAAAMYWYDPASGRRRRALMRQRLGSTLGDIEDGTGVATRDLRHRARGLGARLRSIFAADDAPDAVVTERVRSAIGRAVSHPGAIDVFVTDGHVTLAGAVLADEYEQLLEIVHDVPGVTQVHDQLGVAESANGIPALQGGQPARPVRNAFLRENWPPAVRLLTGAAGGGLVLIGARCLVGRHPIAGLISAAFGGTALVRSWTNVPLRRFAGASGRRAIDIRKTIHVRAPLEHVFATLANHENFPFFMRNVRSVRVHPDGRSHWVVAGPAGTSVEWDSVTSVSRPNEVLAWRTVPNSTVAHAGIIRFEPTDDGTRLDIQMTYNPPAGALGHLVAKLFGADPKKELDEDMVRLKTYLESGIVPHDAARRSAGASPGEPDAVH